MAKKSPRKSDAINAVKGPSPSKQLKGPVGLMPPFQKRTASPKKKSGRRTK